jgi:hypothetical protein
VRDATQIVTEWTTMKAPEGEGLIPFDKVADFETACELVRSIQEEAVRDFIWDVHEHTSHE